MQSFAYHSCPSLGIDCLHLSKLCFLKQPKSCQCSLFVPLLSKFPDVRESSQIEVFFLVVSGLMRHTSVSGLPEMHRSLIDLHPRPYTNEDLMHDNFELWFMATDMAFTNIKYSNCMVHMFLWDSACWPLLLIPCQQCRLCAEDIIMDTKLSAAFSALTVGMLSGFTK